ncbi:hypothetical protein F4859DRAFT_513539 [Xylaria cf. heliscus]|nr:hypothetical protein F4859DRAFT_513539 [Xylaria cf. heliscus]
MEAATRDRQTESSSSSSSSSNDDNNNSSSSGSSSSGSSSNNNNNNNQRDSIRGERSPSIWFYAIVAIDVMIAAVIVIVVVVVVAVIVVAAALKRRTSSSKAQARGEGEPTRPTNDKRIREQTLFHLLDHFIHSHHTSAQAPLGLFSPRLELGILVSAWNDLTQSSVMHG